MLKLGFMIVSLTRIFHKFRFGTGINNKTVNKLCIAQLRAAKQKLDLI